MDLELICNAPFEMGVEAAREHKCVYIQRAES